MTNWKKLEIMLGGYCYSQDGGDGGYDFEDIKHFIQQTIDQAVKERNKELFNLTANTRIFYSRKDDMPYYNGANNAIKEFWKLLGAEQNDNGDWEILDKMKGNDD